MDVQEITSENNAQEKTIDNLNHEPKTENLIMRNNKNRIKNFLNRKYEDLMASKKPKTDIKGVHKINKKKIFVMNIEWSITENILEKFFSKFGQVTKSKIIRDIITKKTDYPRNSQGYGYVHFEREESVAKALNAKPEDLVLKDRQMIIEEFVEKATPEFHKKNLCDEFSKNIVPDDSYINVLPTDVLMNIFTGLCLRDLCMIERVSKRWYCIAQIVWSVKKELILDQKNVFGTFEPKKIDNTGFKLLPKFDTRGLYQVLKKKFSKNLKYLDMSGYSSSFDAVILGSIKEKFSNLTSLNMSNIDLSNRQALNITDLKNIKELNLSYCSKLTDNSISKIFKGCVYIESLDLTLCTLLTGECFDHASSTLNDLCINQCEMIEDKNLLSLFDRNRDFKRISIERCDQYSEQIISFIIQNLTNLEYLNISKYGFNPLTNTEKENANFNHLKNFYYLDISGSVCNNKLLNNLLKTSSSLQILDLSYCTNIDDQAFYFTHSDCPLKEINLTFVRKITDKTLQNLCKFSKTLKFLKIKGCSGMSYEGILDVMIQLPNLELLDIRNNQNVKNGHLELAIKISNERDKNLTILCNDTAINTIEFGFNHPEVTKEYINFNNYRFKYDKLEFEAGLTLKQPAIESDNESEWYDDFNPDDDEYSGNDLYSDSDQEMFRELDEV